MKTLLATSKKQGGGNKDKSTDGALTVPCAISAELGASLGIRHELTDPRERDKRNEEKEAREEKKYQRLAPAIATGIGEQKRKKIAFIATRPAWDWRVLDVISAYLLAPYVNPVNPKCILNDEISGR
jgi:hypothetical protein